MEILGIYKNGNYNVIMLSDGTKIRANELDTLTPQFPESIDLKITNCCDMGCIQCHECSTPDGRHADLNAPFLDTIRPYTELAIGGGNLLTHPDLDAFLRRMKKQGVICNMTVHLDHFLREYERIKKLCDEKLIRGLGVSVNRPLRSDEVTLIHTVENPVIHLIAGIASPETIRSLEDNNLKLLLLGYKCHGRGMKLYQEDGGQIFAEIENLKNRLPEMRRHFLLISFDNLALNQLNVRALVGEEKWKTMYMGEDGQFTMYVDLVRKEYAIGSTFARRMIVHDTIDEMFASVREMSGHK